MANNGTNNNYDNPYNDTQEPQSGMSESQITKIVVAGTVAIVLGFLVGAGFIIGQWIRIGVLNRRIDKLEEDVAKQESILDEKESDLKYYLSDYYKWLEANKHGFIDGSGSASDSGASDSAGD